MLGRGGAVATAREYTVDQQRQLLDLVLHAKADETDGRARIEDYNQQQPPRDVGDVDGFLFALMKEAGKIVLPDQLCQLVVGAVIGGRERRECRRVQPRRVADGGDELAGTVDQERAERLGLAQKAAQGFGYGGEVVLGERPAGRAGGHRAPVTASTRAASASSRRA